MFDPYIDDVTFCKAVKAVYVGIEVCIGMAWPRFSALLFISCEDDEESHFHHRSGGEESTFLTPRQV